MAGSTELSKFRRAWLFGWPVLVLVGYGWVVTAGFLSPGFRPWSEGVSIGLSILLLMIAVPTLARGAVSGVLFLVLLIPGLTGLMISAPTIGPDLALEQHGEVVDAVVTDVHREETTRRTDTGTTTSVRWTYRFDRVDGGPDPGEVVYRGRPGYGISEGQTVELLVDPDGELATQLESEVDSDGMVDTMVIAAVLTGLVWGGGIAWWYLISRRWRRQQRAERAQQPEDTPADGPAPTVIEPAPPGRSDARDRD